ncbi:MAG: tetratricopeptide repeat protein [Bacteroidetes bacterium]|nr:tetratricopeptide repeat protein [Bacteroidota bacterium]
MNLLKTIALASLLLGLIACESPQNVEGNTFVGQQGDGVDDTEVQKLNQEADLLLEQGKTKAARKLLFQSLELEENKTTYNSLGIADQLDLNYPSAIAYYEKALAMDSNYVYARLNLARTYFESGNSEMGIRLNLQVIAAKADSFTVGTAHLHITKIYVKLGDCGAAIHHHELSKEILAGDVRTKEQLERNARLIEKSCHTPEAKFKMWLKAHPGQGEMHDLSK